ncbi:hypothetical protein QT995_26795 [Microcoleus sp. S36b_A3]|uniref:hypothetical protein n=1 Tax=unclassified Microcoleus TaxID=2642155 RepID=UPI002FCE951C
MNVKTVKATLLSEIQELEESLQIIARRVQQGDAVGSHTNIDSSKVNNLIGKYQLLMELRASEAQKQS